MEILITNVGSEPIEIDADSWELKEYRDTHRAAELTIKCSRKVPITRYAHVIASEGHKVLFRGYIQQPRIKNIKTRELLCKGEEDLLLRRFTGRYSYVPSQRRLIHAFKSDVPNQTADAYGVTRNVGLLFMANSLIHYYGNVITSGTPHYDWVALGSWIYKLPGLGLNSRIGSANIYSRGLLLPRVYNWDEFVNTTTIGRYSDATDLYVKINDSDHNIGFGPLLPLFAENAYDTGVRLGQLDQPETVLTGNFQTTYDRILDILIDLAEYHQLQPRYRRDREHTCLDVLKDPVDSEFLLHEDQIEDISQSVNNDPIPSVLIGRGVGSRDVRHMYAPSDHSWKGVWYEDVMDIENGFLDTMGILKPTVDAEYTKRQSNEVFTVVPTSEWMYRPKVNDMVNLRLVGEPTRILQVSSILLDSDGRMELEIGNRKDDIVDAFHSKSSLGQVYIDEYIVEYGKAITITGTIQLGDSGHDWCTGGLARFTIPEAVYVADWSHRVTADITITADVPPEPMYVKIFVNGLANIFCQPTNYLLGDTIQNLDITRYVYYGSQSELILFLKKKGDWVGADCSAHPMADVTVTIRSWKRTLPPA